MRSSLLLISLLAGCTSSRGSDEGTTSQITLGNLDEADDDDPSSDTDDEDSGTTGPKLDMGETEEGTPTTGDTGDEGCFKIQAQVRDFSISHPDFQAFSNDVATPGLVLATLGPDGNPVFSGNVGNPPQMTTAENFNQWYNDVPGVNQTFMIELPLMPDQDGVLVFDDQTFFPLDGMGFGDEGLTDSMGMPHNFLFTTEIHTEFVYEPGQEFKFIGDDDLWLFINGQLVVDLGGLHPAQAGTAIMDNLGLSPGGTYSMDIFHAERRSTDSTFRIETTIECFKPIG